MTRRTLLCDLDANVERPELRKFNGDPVANRNGGPWPLRLGLPNPSYEHTLSPAAPNALQPIASFADWSNLVRSALVWLGCADPADSMEAAREDDPRACRTHRGRNDMVHVG